MTRETKIGLLVGLAFIIVVAILLTDHAATTSDPKSAPLAEVGANVREGVTTPGVGADNNPRSPVPTRADLNAPPVSPVPSVKVEVGPSATPPIALSNDPHGREDGSYLPPISPAPGATTAAPGKPGKPPGSELVKQHPEDLVDVENHGPKPSGPAKPATLPIAPGRTYVAEAGDSVSHIAAKTLGGNTRANREALIKANPSLQGEGNMVFVGKTYVIPNGVAGVLPLDTAKPGAPAAPLSPAAPPVANTTWYTVKDNDNLWRIAARELGDGNLWTQVRDINKDVLKGGETVRANMRIRLPRPSATASVN